MYELKMKLLNNEEELFLFKTEFLSFTIALPLAKLDMVCLRSPLRRLIFSGDIPLDIQLFIQYY